MCKHAHFFCEQAAQSFGAAAQGGPRLGYAYVQNRVPGIGQVGDCETSAVHENSRTVWDGLRVSAKC